MLVRRIRDRREEGGRETEGKRKRKEREGRLERYGVPIKPQGLGCQFVFERSTGGTVPSFLRDISFYKRPKGGKRRQKLGGWRGGADTTEGWIQGLMRRGGWLGNQFCLLYLTDP